MASKRLKAEVNLNQNKIKKYSTAEERLNIASHAMGLILAALGLVVLLFKAAESDSLISFIAYGIYGLSMIVLYTASTFYHAATETNLRVKMRVFDHAAIYVLIAGTYTPFMLLVVPGHLGYGILITAWVLALLGITLKVFFTGRFVLFSTTLYLFMGWAIVFAIKPLAANLTGDGLNWLIAGGVSYTVGAILYAIKNIPFNHAIFHVFVLFGSICHFITVYRYI